MQPEVDLYSSRQDILVPLRLICKADHATITSESAFPSTHVLVCIESQIAVVSDRIAIVRRRQNAHSIAMVSACISNSLPIRVHAGAFLDPSPF